MRSSTEIVLESVLMAALNVAAVYVAAFNYRLNWMGVMTVMVAMSFVTAFLVHLFTGRSQMTRSGLDMMLHEGVSVLSVAGASAVAVLLILTQRFNFPEALGISLLSGGLSAFLRELFRGM